MEAFRRTTSDWREIAILALEKLAVIAFERYAGLETFLQFLMYRYGRYLEHHSLSDRRQEYNKEMRENQIRSMQLKNINDSERKTGKNK